MRNHLLKSIFISLILVMGVANAWSSNNVKVYCAIKASDLDCYTLKVNANIGNNNTWRQYTMQKLDETYEGRLIYQATIVEEYGGVDALQFQLYDGSDWKSQKQPYSSWTTSNNFSGKLYVYDTNKWVAKTKDASYIAYFVNKDNWSGTIKAYAWNSDCDHNKSWSGADMTSEGKTYKGNNIYSIQFNKRYANIIFNNGTSKTNDLTLGSTNAGKMYDGTNWVSYTYDVTATFDANGHGTAPNSQTVLKGNKITEPTAPSENGYTFGGWYKEAACTTKWNFNTDVVNENITLYAKWTEITHTVTFANDGNGTTNKTGEIEVGVVTGIEINAEPNTDYEFKVWESSNGGTFATTADIANNTFYPTANTTLTATFRSTAVNALLVVAGENITSVTGSTEPVTLGSSYPISATFPAGYKFTTWTAEPAANATFTDAESATTNVTVLNGSVTVTASATEILAMLTTNNSFDAGTPTLAIPTTTAEKIGVATTAKITATEAPSGYTFVGWTLTNCERTDGGADNATSITVRSNGDSKAATVVANYAEDLTTSWVLKGSFVDDFATAYDFTKKSGESTGKVAYTTLELDAHKEYHFKVVNGSKWYGNNNYNEGDDTHWIKQTAENWDFYDDAGDCYMKTELAGTYTFKIDYSGSNPKVSVIYPITYTITATAANGTVEGAGTYVEGTTVYLTAIPAEGYHFVKWSNESTTNPLTITVTEDIELQAIFDINTYTVTTTAENGKVTGAGEYTHGTEVTLTATPDFDYEFVNWTVGGTEVSTANPYTFTATADVTVVANFAEVSGTTVVESGVFTVGKYQTAIFATGNLQYKKEGENETWRFAKQQYQVVGEDNIYVGKTDYEGWIDMFGWSNGDANNFGVNASNDNKYYTGTFVDWGTKMGEGWSTLSKEQWDYLLNERDASLKQIAKVGDMLGIMLFPDEWTLPTGCEPVNTLNHDPEDGENTKYDFYSQNYTLAQWTELEKAGAVFLPAAGRRTGGWGNETISPHMQGILGLDSDGHYKYHDNTNYHAYYWTSTYRESDNTATYLHNIKFFGNNDGTVGQASLANEQGRYGQSVRLAKVTDVTPETYTRTVTNGEWGTICLPYASSSVTGATFYEVSSLVYGEGLWLDQLADGDQLVAGKPYIFQATATEIAVTYTGEAVGIPIAGVNGLTGTFTNIAAGGLTGNYIIAENKVWVAGSGATLPANRAYIANTVPTTPQAQIPGRRRVCMGENQTTGLDNITNGENTTIKVIENGQLIIIRNGEKFNAQGQRL